ncbi:MAG TPA: phosphotransferase [Planctomycetaceae bacterium]|nr:phosphotransferase [Planctomycetaceae bacterium]
MTIERTQVLWLGRAPSKTILTEFTRRRLTLTVTNPPLSDRDLSVSRCVVFSFDSKHKGRSIGLVKSWASKAADHGLLVVLHANEKGEDKLLQSHILDFPEVTTRFVDFPRPIKQFSFRKPGYELAELAARHPAGPPLNPDLEIKGEVPTNASDLFLLKRAFSDCKAITIKPLTKGLSGARVLVVYAEFPEGEAAPYPLPYFAKLDRSKRILQEYDAYERFVTRYIPFSQRPNCELKRCLLGSTDGILVGDFVDDSVSLSDLLQPYGARAIIHSLFDDALRGWRQQAFRRDERIALADILPTILDPAQIKAPYIRAAKPFGAKLSGPELTRMLDESSKHLYRRGPVHGDLNTQNVRVKNGEAVMIDFYKSTIGPLVADLASLEIAICFDLEANTLWNEKDDGRYLDSSRFKEWRRHIDALFTFKAGEFSIVPPLQEQPCLHTWMWSACRQLRLMAYYIELDEKAYGYVLAAYMLRMAMFPEDEAKIQIDAPDAVVRSYAYWSAYRLLVAIASHEEAA